LLLFLVSAALVVGGAYVMGFRYATENIRETSGRQLQIIALDLAATLERFETLPFALSFQPEAELVLTEPAKREHIDNFNRTLRTIQMQAKVSAIYLMDRQGNTLASSNWDTEQSYIGKNFAFRPYFRDAMAGLPGRFYGIGSATNEPGYFISQPVYAGNNKTQPVGVMAVKIALEEFEKTWAKLLEPVVLVDRWGVIFLSNQPTWRYRSLAPLSSKVLDEIASTQQYTGQRIEPVTTLPLAQRTGLGPHVEHPVGRLNWQLLIYPDQKPIVRAALVWAVTTALLLALAALSVWAAHQRKRRLEEQGLARKALQQAATELEQQIAERTSELTAANDNIRAKYRKLQEAEHMLRSTQNELVQAGKLTMLGQMAAGVTHELNQPLTAIRAFSDNAKTFLQRGQMQRVDENLTRISAASERMGTIIGQLKGFVRKSDAAVDRVNMAQSIRTSALLLESDCARVDATLDIAIAENLEVSGDAVRIEQVLINLMRNALDAVQDRPRRTVHVSLCSDGQFALVRIADSGLGLAPEVESHLFEPFFTTKSSGSGLGLGLAISSSIVQALNGKLTARNLSDEGAEFSLWLPLAPQLT
jgi:two-component system, NtrC family, C4-dicarboxylate transport sensor histidine kinase DctB